MVEVVVLVVAGIVIFVLLIDGVGYFIASNRPCGLQTFFLIPDSCLGTCPAGTTCVATATRRYFIFGRQATACGCLPPGLGGGPVTPPPGGVPGGGGGDDGGG